MRILVCGGRDCSSSDVWNWLESNLRVELAFVTGHHASLTIEALIHGGARGADEGAERWGKSEHIKTHRYAADWKKHGKAAGPIRNQRMIDEGKPDVVIAFPGGKGTADMVSRARTDGLHVIEVRMA